jgi:hypothetical protein
VKLGKLRYVLAVLSVALMFGILTLLFWDFVRDTIVVPIYYVVWVGGLVLNSIPQGIFVGMLIIIGMLMALNTLGHMQLRPGERSPERGGAQADTRYQYWRRLSDNLYASRFSRNLFFSDARKLILSILAYEQGIDVAEVTPLVKAGALEVPANIRALFQQSEIQEAVSAPTPSESIVRRLQRRLLGQSNSQRNPQLDSLTAEIIGFIEQHLEIPYAGNHPEP